MKHDKKSVKTRKKTTKSRKQNSKTRKQTNWLDQFEAELQRNRKFLEIFPPIEEKNQAYKTIKKWSKTPGHQMAVMQMADDRDYMIQHASPEGPGIKKLTRNNDRDLKGVYCLKPDRQHRVYFTLITYSQQITFVVYFYALYKCTQDLSKNEVDRIKKARKRAESFCKKEYLEQFLQPSERI